MSLAHYKARLEWGCFGPQIRIIAKDSALDYNLRMVFPHFSRRFAVALTLAAGILSGLPCVVTAEEPPTAAASVAPTRTTRKPGPLGSPKEIAQWQLDIAKSSYELRASERNITSVITAYERLIQFTCMPDLSTSLQHPGSPRDPECLKYLEATLALDGENPVATCARDGIDSRACSDAFAAQQTLPYSPLYPLWPPEEGGATDLDIVLASHGSDEEQIAKLNAEVNSLESRGAFNPKLREEVAPRLTEATSQLTELTCKTVKPKIEYLFGMPGQQIKSATIPAVAYSDQFREFLRSQPVEQRPAAIQKLLQSDMNSVDPRAADPNSGPMSEVLRELNPAQKRNPGVSRSRPDGVVRSRYLSPECLKLIEKTLAKTPGSSIAICARDGNSAPTCIQAKRNERSRANAKPSPRGAGSAVPNSKGEKNFSTF
ncbi:MAG: hypothetical protein J0M12_09520 [Deltaproteobacteria bacterium]|nr:hypothetical protein [Deltaproteobacteria bacterium]